MRAFQPLLNLNYIDYICRDILTGSNGSKRPRPVSSGGSIPDAAAHAAHLASMRHRALMELQHQWQEASTGEGSGRLGPARVGIDPGSATALLLMDDLTLEGGGNFSSARANVAVFSGRWQYEVTLRSPGDNGCRTRLAHGNMVNVLAWSSGADLHRCAVGNALRQYAQPMLASNAQTRLHGDAFRWVLRSLCMHIPSALLATLVASAA